MCFQEDPSICMRDRKDIVTLLSISLIGSSLVKPTVSNPNSFAIKPTIGSVTEFISPSFPSKLEWSKVLQKHSSTSVIDINTHKFSSPAPRNVPKADTTTEYTNRDHLAPAAAATPTTSGDVEVKKNEQNDSKPRGMFSIEELRDLQSAISPRQIRESHVTPRSPSPQRHHHTRVSPEHRERDWNSNFTASSKYSSKKYDNVVPKRSKQVRSNSPVGSRYSNEHESIHPTSSQHVDNENIKMAVLDAMYKLFKFDAPTATPKHTHDISDVENEYNEIERYNNLRNSDGSNNNFAATKESEHDYPDISNTYKRPTPTSSYRRPATHSNGQRSRSAPAAVTKRKDSSLDSHSRRASGTFGGSGGRRYDWVVQHLDKDVRKHVDNAGSHEKKGQLNRIIQKVKSPPVTKDPTPQPYPNAMHDQVYGSPINSANYNRNDVDSILTDLSYGSIDNKPDSNEFRRSYGGGNVEAGLRQFILRDVSEAAELNRLHNWLKSIDMGHYADHFVRGGVTKMSIIELLRGDDLISIGIDLKDVPYILNNIRKFSDATWTFTVQELLKKNAANERMAAVHEPSTPVVARVEEVPTLDENSIHEKAKELCWLLDCGNYELFFRVWADKIVPAITFVNEKRSSNDVEVQERYFMRRTVEFYLHLYFIVYTIKNILSESLAQSHFSFYKRAMDDFLHENPTPALLYTKEFTIAVAITMVPSPENNNAYSYFFTPTWSSAVRSLLSQYLFDCNHTSNMAIYLAQVQVESMPRLKKQESVPLTKSDNVPISSVNLASKAQDVIPSHTTSPDKSSEVAHGDQDVKDKSGENTPPRDVPTETKSSNSNPSIFNSNTIHEVLSSGESTPNRVPSFRSYRATKSLSKESVERKNSRHRERHRESYTSGGDDDDNFSIQPDLLNAIKELNSTESRRSLHIVSNVEKEEEENGVPDAFFGI